MPPLQKPAPLPSYERVQSRMGVHDPVAVPPHNNRFPATTPAEAVRKQPALPDAAVVKLTRLRSVASEQRDLSASVNQRILDKQMEMQEAERAYATLTEGLHGDPARHSGVVAAQQRIDQHRAELNRLRAEGEQRKQRRQTVVRLVTRLDEYIAARSPGHTFVAAGTLRPKLQKGEALAEALVRVRADRLAASLERSAVTKAPASLAETLAAAAAQVDSLAERGTPSITRTGAVSWPEVTTRANVQGVAVPQDNQGGVPAALQGFSHIKGIDTLALLAWANRDALIEALDAEIRAKFADQPNSFSAEERAARLAELDAELLSLERNEEALVMEIGNDFDRRSDADQRAVLGIE